MAGEEVQVTATTDGMATEVMIIEVAVIITQRGLEQQAVSHTPKVIPITVELLLPDTAILIHDPRWRKQSKTIMRDLEV